MVVVVNIQKLFARNDEFSSHMNYMQTDIYFTQNIGYPHFKQNSSPMAVL